MRDLRPSDGNSSVLLYQDDCDFNIGFDIEEPTVQKSFNDFVTHCFSVRKCSHFSFSNSNGICNVKKAQALTDRVSAGGGRICGYIPDRLNSTFDSIRCI
jgi:hypothetical protein